MVDAGLLDQFDRVRRKAKQTRSAAVEDAITEYLGAESADSA
jgi:metal-responsive CopG/Arc/MetJ family transcriptional regulator